MRQTRDGSNPRMVAIHGCGLSARLTTTVKSGSSTLQKDDMLNCWTNSSDISGYQADFHEGHGTVGAGQGRDMGCVNYRHGMAGNGMGAAWARHAICESAFIMQVLITSAARKWRSIDSHFTAEPYLLAL